MLSAIFCGISIGIGIYISFKLGARDTERQRKFKVRKTLIASRFRR